MCLYIFDTYFDDSQQLKPSKIHTISAANPRHKISVGERRKWTYVMFSSQNAVTAMIKETRHPQETIGHREAQRRQGCCIFQNVNNLRNCTFLKSALKEKPIRLKLLAHLKVILKSMKDMTPQQSHGSRQISFALCPVSGNLNEPT